MEDAINLTLDLPVDFRGDWTGLRTEILYPFLAAVGLLAIALVSAIVFLR
jgi:hypothetical protein